MLRFVTLRGNALSESEIYDDLCHFKTDLSLHNFTDRHSLLNIFSNLLFINLLKPSGNFTHRQV
jgi:hypothetical protein